VKRDTLFDATAFGFVLLLGTVPRSNLSACFRKYPRLAAGLLTIFLRRDDN
jgi:hypothetical protein